MTHSKIIIFLFLLLTSITLVSAADVYNQNGDFSVEVETQSDNVFNDDISSSFQFTIANNNPFPQDMEIVIPQEAGWDIATSFESFSLNSGESQNIAVTFGANSEFDYSANVVSPDIVKIAQKDEYIGFFEFPITILGEGENVTLTYSIAIDRKADAPISFDAKISRVKLSPISPLKYTINAENVLEPTNAEIKVEIGGVVLQQFIEEFTDKLNYRIYSAEIPEDISPGTYEVKITSRVADSEGTSAQDWYTTQEMEVASYKFISEEVSEKQSIFKDSTHIAITNNGNVDDTYTKSINVPLLSKIIFSASLDGESLDYENTDEGTTFTVNLKRGESKELEYSYNYLALYIVIVILVIIAIYIYIRKTSNPLDVETNIYEVKRVEHEGVKSLKVKIGFENIKENEIDDLRIIFRMPSYLQVKDGSFSLTEPKHVLKGRAQFKLLWDFKRFEKDDARIIGFTLVNKKGVLGDIKIPDLEIEVKVDGKVRKYLHSFPIIRG